MTALQNRLTQVRQRIHDAACSCDRYPGEVHLLAVSKTRPVSDILQLVQCGQRAFGENYLQEALAKIEALQGNNLEWHFIGRIQSNKTRAIAEHFDWVHTLASFKHARRLSEQRPKFRKPVQVCIQLNISGEASKAGIQPDELPELAGRIAQLPGLRLRGLMTMPPATSSEPQQRSIFRQLRKLLDTLKPQHPQADTLSMGMTHDMEAAICEGATIVRIGTALFGPRT